MRIPLDYYRILGLPIQATAEQLQQAHRDRALQLPRREYSEAAIAARKQLLDEAYAVLSNSEQRRDYDASFLAKSYDLEAGRVDLADQESIGRMAIATDPNADPYTPSIEIQDSQLVGALLILLELGEYELVLKLGRPYLSSGNAPLKNGRFGEPDIVLADIVLTVAFACLELGREQWQQGQYENAAESLETGQELLLREGIFASVRGEMQSDLFKLRPYRILELLALPEHHETERRQGLKLLRDMLQDRGGIDGTGDDQSGLNIDDFLRFIQQLRGYLTATEQQTLFEAEARRPSAVATYLAVYALLARGFAQRQPALIRRAKLMLIRLGTRQDVHLEQAVCALLLGQTEEASRALELSQEYESLAFIREHSQGSPDLLPGLCLYGERWLQNEVFPHFRDLARQQASLKDYFADEQVQAYLEELPNEPEPANQWTSVKTTAVPSYKQTPVEQGGNIADIRTRTVGQTVGQSSFSASTPAATATIASKATYTDAAANGTTMPMAERVSQLPSESKPNGTHATSSNDGRGRSPTGIASRSPAVKTSQTNERKRGLTSNGLLPSEADPVARRGGGHRPKLDRLLFIAAIGLLGLTILGFLVSRVYGLLVNRGPSLTGEQLQIQIDQPPVPIPEITAEAQTPNDPNAPMTDEVAQQVIETWLSTKSLARGSEHEIDQLSQILTGEALSQQQYFAEELQQTNSYWEYEHQIVSVQIDAEGQSDTESNAESRSSSAPDTSTLDAAPTETPPASSSSTSSNQAQIVAEVSEVGELYQNGQLSLSQSYDSTVRVRYDVVRQPEGWRIESIEQL